MRFDNSLTDTPARVLFGYFQCYQYFSEFRNELLELFSLNDDIEQEIQAFMSERRRRVGRLVMVHVRREDSLVKGNNWTGLLSSSYFNIARESLGAKTEQLVVFSDDPAWCRAQYEFKDAFIVNEPDPVRTLRLMTYCDDYLIAGSTLSWWGAWLSQSVGKKVIAPQPLYKSLPDSLEHWLIPAEWVRHPATFLDTI
jgi:hypothetical protein